MRCSTVKEKWRRQAGGWGKGSQLVLIRITLVVTVTLIESIAHYFDEVFLTNSSPDASLP